MEIPIIDLYNLANANSSLEVTAAIRKACLDFGFFYVVNHGIADDLQAKVLEKLWQFFNLPVSKKEEIHRRDGFRGYFSKEEEHSIEYGCTEWKEGIYYFREFTNVPKERKETVFCGFNPWPSGEYVPEFQDVMQEYFKRTQELASKLLSCIALSLGINTLCMVQFYLLPSPPPGTPPGICNSVLTWRSIPHPRARRKRQFPTPGTPHRPQIRCFVYKTKITILISVHWQNQTF